MAWDNVDIENLELAMTACEAEVNEHGQVEGLRSFRDKLNANFAEANNVHVWHGERGPFEARPLIAAAHAMQFPGLPTLAPGDLPPGNGAQTFLRREHGFIVRTIEEPNDPPPPGPHQPGDPVEEIMLPLNTILYGPPGTGKTFKTTWSALSLINPDTYGKSSPDVVDEKKWCEYLSEFNRLRRQGRIEFTTFHQNYAYEEFIEGIRPEVKGKDVHYNVEPGVLKRIAYRALYSWITGKEWPQDAKEIPGATVPKRSEGDAGPSGEAGSTQEGPNKTVRDWLSGDGTEESNEEPNRPVPNYVLIIDEINRGNVARILGELITLIEDSKRTRRKPALGQQPLKVTLPYTKEPFILPPNLYLLGTMNTADRSLVGLDLALRRRFSFEELAPRPELLKKVADVELKDFLEALNDGIERHLDRDHRIGHAFLMGVKDMSGLAQAMEQKVLPQLMEYFHDRPDLLAKVLQGTDFVKFRPADSPQRIEKVDSKALGNAGNYTKLKPAE